jgi:hypothetical protein
MLQSLKQSILWLDGLMAGLWSYVLKLKDVFIHGDFSYWGYFKNNVHLFLVLGIFGALTGYLNTFIEREVPFNAYAGKLGVNQTPLSLFTAALSGRSPLSTPFPPADLVFGITCALLMFVLIAAAILWSAVNYTDNDARSSSELSLLSRISFITLFGSLMLVFLSYLIRNYGLLIQALLEIFSAFAALYVLAFMLKHTKKPGPWLLAFIILGVVIYAFRIYIPALSIFSVSLGLMSAAISIIMLPLVIIKKAIQHLKEKHLG